MTLNNKILGLLLLLCKHGWVNKETVAGFCKFMP